MTRCLIAITVCSCLLALCRLAGADDGEIRELYLKGYVSGYRGPYRGRVIDSETRAPLPGAIVVALWRRDRIYPLGSVRERYAVREIVTDADGRFVMEARDVEEHAPRRTRPPEFCIFRPGYGSFPAHHTAPRRFIGGIFEGAGATVELPRLSARRERLETVEALSPYSFSDNPFQEVPRLTELINQELHDLGLEPYSASGRRE